MLAGDCELQQSAAKRITNYLHELSAIYECGSGILETGMDEIKPKKHFSNIIDIIEFAVEVLALQELTQLIEN